MSLSRSSLYYARQPENSENLSLMEAIDRQYTQTPFYGVRRIKEALTRQGYSVNHKRVRRLMRLMGLEAIYPKPKTSQANRENKVYPYLLKNLAVTQPNQVWAADITYIPMKQGFVYLVAILDWYSRAVLSWKISTTLDSGFCLETLEEALSKYPPPDIFNTDQGCQFTSLAWTQRLETADVQISMDGKGRYLDNIFVERLWRTVKYEDVYLKRYETVREVKEGLKDYFSFYNHQRLHQALDYKTPAQVYNPGVEKPLKSLEWLTPLATFQQLSDDYDDEVKKMDRLRA